MKKVSFWASLLISALFCSGCCAGNGEKIACEGWELEEKSLPEIQPGLQKPDRDITFVIGRDGKFYGCAGINRYFGTAKLDMKAKTLKFGNIGTTMMAGPGGEYERAFLKMLNSVDSYKICGDDLYLLCKGKIVAEFDHESLRDINDND